MRSDTFQEHKRKQRKQTMQLSALLIQQKKKELYIIYRKKMHVYAEAKENMKTVYIIGESNCLYCVQIVYPNLFPSEIEFWEFDRHARDC